MGFISAFVLAVGLATCLPIFTAGIKCLQCNVFVRGSTNTCDNPSTQTGCYSCLKTLTKIKMHDRWGVQKISAVISRYCIREVSSALYRDEGCYKHPNNGGYTERCYCYSNNCNSGMTLRPQWMSLCIVLSTAMFFGGVFR
ncbi:uncharacterized protein LOC121382131 [Gigantopelta aegis]|uniref:uncharacterized protein LOC121382131 n=1 Tax=Gigantopelta aegis TaxID=1735272 RepID=UPI001B888A40|nr:uncharacterized protein LOC121382131 [Gigantopelta aegis]